MSFRGRLANVLEAFKAKESLLSVYGALLRPVTERQWEEGGGCVSGASQPGTADWLESNCECEVSGRHLSVQSAQQHWKMHKVQAARSRETSVGTDTTSELLLHFSTPLDLTVTAARVLQSKLVLKGRISIRSTCKFLDYTVVGCLRCTYYGDAAACATVSKSRGLFQYFEICFKISAADTCDCETVISLHPQRSESQTGVHRVSWLTDTSWAGQWCSFLDHAEEKMDLSTPAATED